MREMVAVTWPWWPGWDPCLFCLSAKIRIHWAVWTLQRGAFCSPAPTIPIPKDASVVPRSCILAKRAQDALTL